jgi:hypothetical protein
MSATTSNNAVPHTRREIVFAKFLHVLRAVL